MLTTTDTRITENAVKQMENRLAQLEQTVLRLTSLIPEASMPEACQKRLCSYHTHYLQYGGPDLSHEQYHTLEKEWTSHNDRCGKEWNKKPGVLCSACTSYDNDLRH